MAVLLASAVAACESRPGERTDDTAGATGTTGRESIGMMDREFIEDQLQDGQAEVRLGQLASERAQSEDVKQFAQMMVRDHTKAGNDLEAIVRAENLQIEQPDEAAHEDLYQRLSKLSGAEFDREYIEAMVDDHENAVDELERRTDADNPSLQQFATNTLPVVRQHLERAKAIQKQLEGRATGE